MAVAPDHRLGQIIGEMVEVAVVPPLQHSKNKAQEMQAAVLPVLAKCSHEPRGQAARAQPIACGR